MTEEECLAAIENGATAYKLLTDTIPGIEKEFMKVDKAIIKLLARVREHFPDARYYTASGGFNLLLGNTHAGLNGRSQQELSALGGYARIEDGDY